MPPWKYETKLRDPTRMEEFLPGCVKGSTEVPLELFLCLLEYNATVWG